MTTNEVQNKISELQIAEQSLQTFSQQKQLLQAQNLELESALSEIVDDKETYKIVGNIMIKLPSTELKTDLESKKEVIGVRLNKIESQENKLAHKVAELQKEILKQIENKE